MLWKQAGHNYSTGRRKMPDYPWADEYHRLIPVDHYMRAQSVLHLPRYVAGRGEELPHTLHDVIGCNNFRDLEWGAVCRANLVYVYGDDCRSAGQKHRSD